MKIIMKLCPNMEKINDTEPLLEETKENGIKIFTQCKDEKTHNDIMRIYSYLPGKDFDERVKLLKELEEKGERFFTLYMPSARYILVRDEK